MGRKSNGSPKGLENRLGLLSLKRHTGWVGRLKNGEQTRAWAVSYGNDLEEAVSRETSGGWDCSQSKNRGFHTQEIGLLRRGRGGNVSK